jgi:hypothetical protein
MQVGAPLRTIFVEPLEFPVKQPAREPEADSVQLQKQESEKVPVAQ